MPNPNPNGPIVQGLAPATTGFPQWGVKQVSGHAGQATAKSDYSTKEVTSLTQKNSYLAQGYDLWFSTSAAASSYISGQVGNANNPANKAANTAGNAISSVTDFLQGLTSEHLWIRVAKVAIGGLILLVGIAKLANLQNSVAAKAVKAAPFL
jgi:hypothetical protein